MATRTPTVEGLATSEGWVNDQTLRGKDGSTTPLQGTELGLGRIGTFRQRCGPQTRRVVCKMAQMKVPKMVLHWYRTFFWSEKVSHMLKRPVNEAAIIRQSPTFLLCVAGGGRAQI